MVSALAGCLATLAHDSIMTPLDVVKQRMQLGLYKNTLSAFRTILRVDGVRALYASYLTTLFMNIPNNAILVASNDFLKKWLNPSGQQVQSLSLYPFLEYGRLLLVWLHRWRHQRVLHLPHRCH